MPIEQQALEALLSEQFPNASINVKDLAGDNDHYAVTITSPDFIGKTRIEQHMMVHDALKEENIHALSITAKRPTEQ